MSDRKFVENLKVNRDDVSEALSLFKSYAIGTSPGVQLPTGFYIKELSDITGLGVNEVRKIAADFKAKFFKPSNINISKRIAGYLGMYNATLDIGDLVDLMELKKKVDEKGLKEKTVDGYTIKGLKFTARYGRFKPVHQYTEEYGPKKLLNIPDSQISAVELTAKVKKDGIIQGASFTVFKSGKVRFSGGYTDGKDAEPRALIRYADSILELGMANKNFTINNITSEVKVAANIDILQIFETFDVSTSLARFDGFDVKVVYEPTRGLNQLLKKNRKDSPFLYVKFNDKSENSKFTLLLSANGSMIMEGVSDMRRAAKTTERFIEFMKAAGMLSKGKNVNLAISPKATKIARRLNMKPAPDVTRRGTTCPKDKRPVPYSFQGTCPGGNKEYVRPNPQGQPCCYRIPKRVDYLRNKVANRYARANVKIPNKVKQLFGITDSAGAKNNNVGRAAPDFKFYFNDSIGKNKKNPVGFKIGTRQCMRYSKVALVDIATRMGIANPADLPKEKICEAIARKAKGKNSNVTAKVSGKRVVNVGDGMPVIGKDKKLRLGKRLCESYKKEVVMKYAKAMGADVNDKMSKSELCKAIELKANKIRPKPKSPAVSAANMMNSAKSNASNNLNRLLAGSAKSNTNSLNRLLAGSAKSNTNSAKSNASNNLNNLLASVRKGANSNDENFNYFMNLAGKLKNNNR